MLVFDKSAAKLASAASRVATSGLRPKAPRQAHVPKRKSIEFDLKICPTKARVYAEPLVNRSPFFVGHLFFGVSPEFLVFVFVIAALFFPEVNARKYFFYHEYSFILRCFCLRSVFLL